MTLPQLVIIAGPNGSGKSTLLSAGDLPQHGIQLPQRPYYINADEIAQTLREEGLGTTPEGVEWEAFHRARALRQTYREQRASFAFETVFSHPSTLLDMRKCLDVGYEVTLVFIGTASPEINVARVEGRVRQGGHDVAAGKIRSRYERSLRYLPRAVEMASRALVFDATQERQTRLCFQKRRFVTVRDPPQYLQVRLVDILGQRQEEREAAQSQFGTLGTLMSPDEDAGEYAGPFRSVVSSYVVQETAHGRFFLHDRLLLPVSIPVPEDAPGHTPVGIRYNQGDGLFVPLSHPA